ncbi:MAG: hypothetical protein KGY99_00415 [Phycisphaerae bacterium]|nr:hypothetical protein [Phycisphaerae bacterium]
MNDEADNALLCHRCGAVLRPGAGNWYVVRVEAFADPTPPEIATDADPAETAAEIERLIEQMRHSSATDLAEQVYRRMTLHLCGRCYAAWIENPTG